MRVLMGSASIQAADNLSAMDGAGQAFTLNIRNQNMNPQNFALFQTLPSTGGVSQNPLVLAWILGTAAKGSPSNPSVSRMEWTVNYQVNTGYLQPLGEGDERRSFATNSNVAVDSTQLNMVGVEYYGEFPQGVPQFSTDPAKGPAGVVTANADGSIPTLVQQKSVNKALSVGLAIDGKTAVAFELQPNLTYSFTPKPTYYILSGAFIEGQVVDTSIVTGAFKVDFTGVNAKTLIFTADNKFQNAP